MLSGIQLIVTSERVCIVKAMPRISAFYGIVIATYFDDHPPPHFHARFGEFEAQIAISTAEVLHGSLRRRALGLI
jgi:hypothetical protein